MDQELLEKRADVLRELIYRENEVTNQRLTWLLVGQGFLFAAAAELIDRHPFLVLVIGALSIVTTVSIRKSLVNSYESRQHLKNSWRSLVGSQGYRVQDFAPLDGGRIPDKARERPVEPSWFPWTVIPDALIWGWFGFLFYATCECLLSR